MSHTYYVSSSSSSLAFAYVLFCLKFLLAMLLLLLFGRCCRCWVVGYNRRRKIYNFCSVSRSSSFYVVVDDVVDVAAVLFLSFGATVSSVKCNRADESWRYGKEFWSLFAKRCAFIRGLHQTMTLSKTKHTLQIHTQQTLTENVWRLF